MYTWLYLTLISGILLGVFDITKKKALEKSSLLTVLTLYTILNFLLVSFEFRSALTVDRKILFIVLLKSIIIYVSWIMSFTAIRGLPISIITPFGTLSPIFSIFLGLLFLGESLSYIQIGGLLLIFASYYFIGKIGKMEVAGLFKNKYLYLMAGGMLLSATSAMLDKIALKTVTASQMQFWFSLFTAILFLVTLLIRERDSIKSFTRMNWYIPLMSILLVFSDRLYYIAVKIPESQISVVMPLRKISIVVSTIIGGLIFKEKNLKSKLLCVLILLVGIIIEFMA